MKWRTRFLEIVVVMAMIVMILLAVVAFWHVPFKLALIYHHQGTAVAFGVGIYMCMASFLVGCHFAWNLLRCVDRQLAFSAIAVKNLAHLKWAVAVIALGLVATLPEFYVAAQAEDAPGLVLIGATLTAIPIIVTVFLAILQRLWAAALVYKDENDLTV